MTLISRCLAVTAALALSTGMAVAATAIASNDLNMRAGPGPGYAVVGVIPGGAPVEVMGCTGSWCQVNYGGRTAFASSSHLQGAGAVAAAVESPAYEYHDGYGVGPNYTYGYGPDDPSGYGPDYYDGSYVSGPYYSGPVVGFGFGGFHGDHGRWATTAGRAPVIGSPRAWQGHAGTQGRAGGAFSGRMSANVGAGATPAVGMGRGFGGSAGRAGGAAFGGGAGHGGGGHAR
jgi:Bacterial SH3 domain